MPRRWKIESTPAPAAPQCTCVNCGRTLELNSIFCNWCGARQIAEKKQEIPVPKPIKRANGKYFIELRKEQWSGTFNTAEEAIAAATVIRTGYLEKRKKCEVITLHKAIDRYIEERSNVLSPSTIRGYRIMQKTRFPDLMEMYVGDIDSEAAQRSINKEANKGISAKTIKNAWRFCQTVIHEINPKEEFNIKLPQLIPHETTYLEAEQIPEFCEAIKGTNIEIWCLLALHSLRASEINGLAWEDIDTENGIIHVHGAKVRDEFGNYVQKKETKNVSSRRDIPIMIPRLIEAVNAADHSVPVCSEHPSQSWNRLHKILVQHPNLPSLSPHSLRHTFATLALTTLQMPENVVMKLGGWSTPETMKKIYRHTAEKEIGKQVTQMKDFYAPKPAAENSEAENNL